MTQTRTLLFFAWLMVAALLWMEWSKEQSAPPATSEPAAAGAAAADANGNGAIPNAAGAAPAAIPDSGERAAPTQAKGTFTLSNDLLRLTLDAGGGSVLGAELLAYAESTDEGSPPVKLLDDRAAHYFVAQAGLISAKGPAPSHEAVFQPEATAAAVTLADGAERVERAFVWTDASGLSVRRVYTLERGSYVVTVRDEISNGGSAPWSGHAYRQLVRAPVTLPTGHGLTNPEAYSFRGAAWYSPQEHFEKRKFDDFIDDGPLDRDVAGGWIAMLQHHFLAAWVPQAEDAARYSLGTLPVGATTHYFIREVGPALSAAPGASAETVARLWIGPKLQDKLEDIAPGLKLTLDYGIFTFLAQPLAWLLSLLHTLTGNWGWAIILLVLMIKLALYKLSETQYKSFAKMRAIQPRIEALKERYGDDRQKFQQAMMELYKKEKINPMGGCLPILVQIPVFIALYWVLLESVELRQAPWMLWIQNLTARDPYFVLPALNMAVMWLTQKMTPSPGMDPMQKKMMQAMPLVFGVMFAFFPAGLVLYWVTNGLLGLLQQWWLMKRHGGPTPAKA